MHLLAKPNKQEHPNNVSLPEMLLALDQKKSHMLFTEQRSIVQTD